MKQSSIKAVCFDMWGTLFKGGGDGLWLELQEILGVGDIPVKEFIKKGEEATMLHSYPLREGVEIFARSVAPNTTTETIETAYQHWWSYIEKAEPYKETQETLRALQKTKIPLVILSNTDASSFNFVLEKFQMENYFRKWFLSAEIGLLKPQRKIFQAAQNYLKSPKQNILLIDDSLNRAVLPAREFGWQALWIARGKQGKDFGRIESLKGIFDYL